MRAWGLAIKDSFGADVTDNYDITYTDNTRSTITKASLTVTAAQLSKTYDGTTSASGDAAVGTLAGAGAGESVSTAASLAFTDKNVGSSNKTVRASGLAIQDSDGEDVTGNYDITYTDNNRSTIHKANLTKVTASKTYDGSKEVTAAQMTAIEGVNGEIFTASAGTATISDKNVATANKTLTDLTDLTLESTNGGDRKNYNLDSELPAAGAGNAVTITAKDATVTANSNTSLIYNGFNQTVSGFTASGLQGGETENVLTGVTASTTRKNAGSYSTTASGSDSNYQLTFVDGLMVIAEADLTEVTEEESSNAGTTSTSTSTSTPTQSASYVPPAPVVDDPPLPSDTSYVKAAFPAQNTQPISRSFGINTPPPTGAGKADNLVNQGPQGSKVNFDEKLPDCESKARDSVCGNAIKSPSSSTSDAGSGDTSNEAVSKGQISQR